MATWSAGQTLRRPRAWPILFAVAVLTLVSLTYITDITQFQFGYDVPRLSSASKVLQIMPLGDSITAGDKSSDDNGYRWPLLQKLAASGNTVEFIGSRWIGTMENNAHDGYGGLTIDEIIDQAGVMETLARRPDVVLLHAGTNDVYADGLTGYEAAPERLGSMLDRVLEACPSATVIVAQIISCNGFFFPDSVARVETYRAAIPKIVAARAAHGFKVMTVDMSSIGRDPKDLFDTVHPNDSGYARLADLWYQALHTASDRGLITGLDFGD